MRKLPAHLQVFVPLCLAASLGMPTNAALAAEVIHDAGDTVPSAQYLGQLFAFDADQDGSSVAPPPGLQLVAFPIRSPLMHIGVPPDGLMIKHPEWLAQPVFLLGTDATSKRWLETRAARLKAMDAVGIVVDADDYAAFRQLQRMAPELMLAPASVAGIESSLGINVYPVLVQTDGTVTP